MKRLLMVAAAIPFTILMSVGFFLAGTAGSQELPSKIYAYPVSAGEKTYTITGVTNWDSEPKVSLSNTSLSSEHYVLIDFFGQSSRKTVFYNITIPIDLLSGNITLIWKYYLQSPDRYMLSNNGTHNSIQMTFEYQPYFSGMGHFEICGTEGAW